MIPKLLRKRVRSFVAHPSLQPIYRTLYRVSLIGMNYGGAGSTKSSGDELALKRLAKTGGPFVVFDVGANIGSYAARVLELLPSAEIHAFEPGSAAFAQLQHHFGNRLNVHLIAAGLAAAEGNATLYSDAPGSVLASTYAGVHDSTAHGEAIALMTLDAYCERERIQSIDLLKLDVEGGELAALQGAKHMLERTHLIQFEFGQPSLASHTNFGDLFKLLDAKYSIHRVLPNGLVALPSYHETLEVFMSTNYLAVARAWQQRTAFLAKR